MTKKTWIIVAVALAGLVLLGAAGVGGGFLYLEYRNQGWLREALAAYDKGEWARARGYFERYLPQDPKNDELLTKYADACLKLTTDRIGSLRAASIAYQQILMHHPEREEVRQQLIDVYIKLSAWSTIEYYTGLWLRPTPDDANVLYYHALALDNMGKVDEAMQGYEALIAQQTDRSDVYGSYARLLREKGLEARAGEVFVTARKARPQDGRIVADYARFIARKSTWTEIENLLNEALTLSPNDAEVLVAAAQAEMLRRQYGRAAELLERAIKAKPDESPAYLMLASVNVYQGMNENAIKVLQRADEFVKVDSPMMLITLADLQLGMSAFDDAKQTIDAYTAAYPDQLPISEYFTAKELLVRGEPSEAVKRLASVIQLRPGFALAQYTLAEAYLASGETELARHALETYLSTNATDERAQRLMAQRFGRPVSIETMAARLEELIKQDNPDQQRLLTISALILEAAVRQNAVSEYDQTLRSALEKVISADPTASMPYRILADVALLQGKPKDAVAVLDKGVAQGCDPNDFLMLRAGAAYASNDAPSAEKYIAEGTALPEFTYTDYVQWATFFALHDQYKEALSMLDRGIERSNEGEAKVTLEVERALLALRHGDLAMASDSLDRATPRVAAGTSLRRRLNAARLQLAQTYLVTDASQEAEQTAQKIIHAVRQEDPGNAALHVSDGLLLMRKTPPELDRAQALFESAAAADSASLGAQWGLAMVALARMDYPRALTHIERALSLAPGIPALRLLQADALLKTDRLFEADRAIQRILKDQPDNSAAAQLLVECMLRRGDKDGAAAAMKRFDSLAASDPNLAENVRALRSELLAAHGEDKAAEDALRAQVAEYPDDIDILRSLARVILRQGREAEAKGLLMDFAEAHNADPAVWVSVAQWWADSDSENRWREASTCLTRALLANPDYIPAVRAMLAIRLRQRDNLEALGLCNRYLTRNPDDADMLNTKARLLGQINGRLQEALAAADRAVELDDRAEYKGTRGVILVAMRQYDRALRDLRPYAAEARETSAQVDAALAEAYFATNELTLARQYLDSALGKADGGEAVDIDRLHLLQDALAKREQAA